MVRALLIAATAVCTLKAAVPSPYVIRHEIEEVGGAIWSDVMRRLGLPERFAPFDEPG